PAADPQQQRHGAVVADRDRRRLPGIPRRCALRADADRGLLERPRNHRQRLLDRLRHGVRAVVQRTADRLRLRLVLTSDVAGTPGHGGPDVPALAFTRAGAGVPPSRRWRPAKPPLKSRKAGVMRGLSFRYVLALPLAHA